jgi:hypothetical protein
MEVGGEGWCIKTDDRGPRGGMDWNVKVTSLGGSTCDMLRSGKYRALASPLRLVQMMDRMGGRSEGEDAEDKHKAERHRSSPPPHPLGQGKGRQQKAHEH